MRSVAGDREHDVVAQLQGGMEQGVAGGFQVAGELCPRIVAAEFAGGGDEALLEAPVGIVALPFGHQNLVDRREEVLDVLARTAAAQAAAARVRSYHEAQKKACGESWSYRDADGSLLGQKVTPLDRVGIYVPGGKAAYPSSVLMNAIPAHVAGVGEIIMVVPTPGGEKNPLVLAAAYVASLKVADILFLVSAAFSFAAAAFFPALVLGVFWKRMNRQGVCAGMLAGLAMTLYYLITRDPLLQAWTGDPAPAPLWLAGHSGPQAQL